MWRAVARALSLGLGQVEQLHWIALIWRVRSARLKRSIRAATVESALPQGRPVPAGAAMGWPACHLEDALAATVDGGVTDGLWSG